MAQVATKIMAGRELGIGPFAAVNGIHIVKGKPTIGANLMAAAVKSSGRYDYRVLELTADKCRIEYRQRNGEKWEVLGVSEFTKADATKASTQNMDKFPKNMLFARAMSNGVRFYTPDIFSGNAVYTPEELGATVDGEGEVVEANFTVTKPTEATQTATTPVEATEQPVTRQHESTPIQRLFGQGSSAFGKADWDGGARAWLVEKWTEKVSPNNVRTSASRLADEEIDLLADYIAENLATLQRVWKNRKAAMQQSTGEKVAVAA